MILSTLVKGKIQNVNATNAIFMRKLKVVLFLYLAISDNLSKHYAHINDNIVLHIS